MRRITADPLFPVVAGYAFPQKPVEQVREEMNAVDSVRKFQENFMAEAVKRIVRETMTEFTCSGIGNIDPSRPHVFISNHRDIVLDASLLQQSIMECGLDTTEITFGANLMRGNLVVEIGKSNKMFKVERPGSDMRSFYSASRHLSEYIFHTTQDRKSSIWIAQRNGRTKDGTDRTDPGIINMFTMCGGFPPAEILSRLSLQPVAVSYEWEPCDLLKVIETVKKEAGPYEKAEGEDLNSIITGLMQKKGRVHLHICPPISASELEGCKASNASNFRKNVADLVDSRICPAYKLFPNNYIAHDLLHGSDSYSSRYTTEQKESFISHMEVLNRYEDVYDKDKLRRYFLRIYANPVDSAGYFNR